MARIPREVAASFTPEQLRAVQHAFGMRYTMDHAIDLRRTVRLPWGRYYLVLLAGQDRRGGTRRTSGAALPIAFALALALGTAITLVFG